MSGRDKARRLLATLRSDAKPTGADTAGPRASYNRPNKLATIDPLYTGGTGAKVTFDGETTKSAKAYPFLGTLPTPGARVLMVPIGRGYVIVAGDLGHTLERRAGLGIKPTSVVVGSGTASVADDGTVTFSGVNAISLNGVFSLLGTALDDAYRVTGYVFCSGDPGGLLAMRLRVAGADMTTGHYYSIQGYEVATAWGSVSHGTQGNSAATSWQIGARQTVDIGLDLRHIASALGNKEMLGLNGSDGTNQVVSTLFARTDLQPPFDGFSILPSAVVTMSGFLKVVRVL